MLVRILVVDDSALYRQLVRNVLRTIDGVEVVGVATSGSDALQKLEELEPDLLTLDVEMPELSGLDVLREMKKRRSRAKAVMLSSLTKNGAQITADSLLAGAFDFIHKPNSSDAESNRQILHGELSEKIEAFRESIGVSLPRRTAKVAAEIAIPAISSSSTCQAYEAVVIGTSTGGPVALREVLPKLPRDLGVPVLVVQHMPKYYTQSLAERVNDMCELTVLEAQDGMRVEPNKVYIAPGGSHLKLSGTTFKPILQTTDEPPEHNCRPSVDYLFRSAANFYNGRVLGVVLTGMGRDGTEGCREIKRLGGFVIAQHPDGCVVYGMPKVVVEQQLVDRVVPLDKIAAWIVRELSRSRIAK